MSRQARSSGHAGTPGFPHGSTSTTTRSAMGAVVSAVVVAEDHSGRACPVRETVQETNDQAVRVNLCGNTLRTASFSLSKGLVTGETNQQLDLERGTTTNG